MDMTSPSNVPSSPFLTCLPACSLRTAITAAKLAAKQAAEIAFAQQVTKLPFTFVCSNKCTDSA